MFTHFRPFFENKSIRTTGWVFVLAGILLGTWTVLIPYIKAKFSLSESELGLLLLCMPFGVTIANPITVPMLRKFGMVNSTSLTHAFAALVFVSPIVLPNIWAVAFSLFLTGMAYSCLNIAMNTCASELEKLTGRLLMSTMHGMWSLGAMLGAASSSFIMGNGVEPLHFMLGIVAFNMGAVLFFRKPLKKIPEPKAPQSEIQKKGFIWPNRELWLLVVIGVLVCLTEGSMTDWAGVYMRDVLEAPEAQIGWGYAVYAFFMAAGRLLGDGLIGKIGSKALLQIGGVVASVGLFLLAGQMGFGLSLLGFVMVGAGVSIGAPILYAQSAKVPGLPTGAGLATFNTFAMVGFLGGPAFIGFLAEEWSLPFAFGVVAVGALVWAVFSRRV